MQGTQLNTAQPEVSMLMQPKHLPRDVLPVLPWQGPLGSLLPSAQICVPQVFYWA